VTAQRGDGSPLRDDAQEDQHKHDRENRAQATCNAPCMVASLARSADLAGAIVGPLSRDDMLVHPFRTNGLAAASIALLML